MLTKTIRLKSVFNRIKSFLFTEDYNFEVGLRFWILAPNLIHSCGREKGWLCLDDEQNKLIALFEVLQILYCRSLYSCCGLFLVLYYTL